MERGILAENACNSWRVTLACALQSVLGDVALQPSLSPCPRRSLRALRAPAASRAARRRAAAHTQARRRRRFVAGDHAARVALLGSLRTGQQPARVVAS